MFGGHGLYCDGAFFALVLDDVLYLKADELSRPRFLAAGLEPFVYERQGKRASLGYYRAPPEALESPDAALAWGREALGAALRVSAGESSRLGRSARRRAKPMARGRRRTGKA
jgi:DNA transformation protein and related proteins